MLRVLILAPLLALAGCQDPDGARDVLDAQGYRDIEIVARSYWVSGCGKGDSYETPFTAKGPNGVAVEGVVCSTGGWSKGATVRITKVIRSDHRPAAPRTPEAQP